MPTRPDWDEYFLQMAYLAATRATCDRKHVGAVIVDGGRRILSTGYNGSPRGAEHCDEVGHELHEGHCIRTIHAEDNAIAYAGRKTGGCTLYSTVIPCYDCAKRILQSGIRRVVFSEFYQSRYEASDRVVDFLEKHGVKVACVGGARVQAFAEMLKKLETGAKD